MISRPGSFSNRQTRMQGIGNQPPADPHGLIPMYAPEKGQLMNARRLHIDELLKKLQRDEDDAIKQYQNIIEEVDIFPALSFAWRSQIKEIATHIKNQEIQHKALLERLRI